MLSGMRLWALAFAAGLVCSGCLPAPADILGKACDPDHLSCGPELECRAGLCSVKLAAPENLIANGAFDATPNGLVGWNQGSSGGLLALSTDVYRSAPPSAWVKEDTGTDPYLGIVLDRTAVPSPATSGNTGKTYCAESWIRQGTAPVKVTMYLRRFGAASPEDSSSDEFNSHLTTSLVWAPLRASLAATAPGDLAMVVRFFAPRTAGGDYYVDDVRIWVSPDGACP